jgi:hypothetical protein
MACMPNGFDLRVYRHVPVDAVDLSRGCSLLSQQLELEAKCPRPGMLNFVAILECRHGAEARTSADTCLTKCCSTAETKPCTQACTLPDLKFEGIGD